jgi:16S rRNA (cytidine1402-2'-O)-methyltransferase
MAGTLSVVATPIGNLQDITLRAIETLKSADLIACEDTRHAGILLRTYDVCTPTTSYHSYSGAGKAQRILEALREGKRVALISDAGLPGISDPGYALIHGAIAAGIPVEVVPGASASLVGLVLSGFPTDRFVFEGFLPVKPGARRNRLTALKDEPRTVVFYESPHRLVKTLADIEAVFGDIRVSVSRELTKRFEETRRESVSRLREHFSRQGVKGEFVVVLPPQRLRSDGQHRSS